MKRLKIDGRLFTDEDNTNHIYEFDLIETDRFKRKIKCYREGKIIARFEGVHNIDLFKIINEDGSESDIQQENQVLQNKDSNLELLSNEMIQASMKFELQDLHEEKDIIEEKAQSTIDNINNKLKDLGNKDNQYKEDINSIKDSIKLMLDKFDSRFSELEKNIVSLNNSIYTINSRLKEVK